MSPRATGAPAGGSEAVRHLCHPAQGKVYDVAQAFAAAVGPPEGQHSSKQQHSSAVTDATSPLIDLLQRVMAAIEDAAAPGTTVRCKIGKGIAGRAVATFRAAVGGAMDVLEACIAAKLHNTEWLVAAAASQGGDWPPATPSQACLQSAVGPCLPCSCCGL